MNAPIPDTGKPAHDDPVSGVIPDGPMLDRLIGDAMRVPDVEWCMGIGPRAGGIFAIALACGAFGAVALLRRRR